MESITSTLTYLIPRLCGTFHVDAGVDWVNTKPPPNDAEPDWPENPDTPLKPDVPLVPDQPDVPLEPL